jgi:hypothetical protein
VQAGTFNVTTGVPPTAPALQSLTPNSGSGTGQTFTVTFADANGHADIALFSLLINSGLNGYNGCFLSYNRAQNRISLFRDSDGSWPSLVPGSGTLSNANCTLNGAGVTVTGTGNTLTVTLPLTFTAAFSGQRQLYAFVQDEGNLYTDWVWAGEWLRP